MTETKTPIPKTIDNAFELAIYEQGKFVDKQYALDLYNFLENSSVYTLKGEPVEEYGMRSLACFIADLRGDMDDYCEFYCNPHGGRDLSHVEADLRQLGYLVVYSKMEPRDHLAQLKKLMDSCE